MKLAERNLSDSWNYTKIAAPADKIVRDLSTYWSNYKAGNVVTVNGIELWTPSVRSADVIFKPWKNLPQVALNEMVPVPNLGWLEYRTDVANEWTSIKLPADGYYSLRFYIQCAGTVDIDDWRVFWCPADSYWAGYQWESRVGTSSTYNNYCRLELRKGDSVLWTNTWSRQSTNRNRYAILGIAPTEQTGRNVDWEPTT